GFLESGAVIGDFTLIHTFADDTAYSATESTFEGFRDGDTYGTPPFTLIQTWEEQTAAPAFTGLLNESYGSGAEAAYSTRRLNGNVTECMVIRRASDSTTTTIGFDGSGNIDEAAINTFCSGTTCTVSEWKDQSGNGNHATQSTAANQPTIYTGGALVKENGKVALNFNGDYLDTTSISSQSVFLTINTTSAPLNGAWLGLQSGTDMFGVAGSGGLFYRLSGANTFQSSLLNTGYYLNAYTISSSNSLNVYQSGTIATESPQSVGGVANFTRLMSREANRPAYGNAQEMIMYASDKSSVRTSIESNIGDYFTQNTPLLDTYTGAAACYSLRLMRSAYTGSAVEVYNGTSYADIGFNVFGELDTVALAAHCGSNDG
ncbi:MAG: hypothetical protein EBT12_16705, partial [Marivivens sp.]|nr:hypothetical protein [Marivivens sp.]